tara:strand:+ start:3472 stop:4071 length:600 start_codon:yes stop_codon:yes gene_type:complete
MENFTISVKNLFKGIYVIVSMVAIISSISWVIYDWKISLERINIKKVQAKEAPSAPVVDLPQTAIESRGYVFYATATVYNMEESQCDSTPDICADGTRASYDKRILAVSRDQLERWGGKVKYGDKIQVTGAGKHDGVWNVHDTMNRRYGATAPTFDYGVNGIVEPHSLDPVKVDGVAHIDFLTTDRLGKWYNVKCEVIK